MQGSKGGKKGTTHALVLFCRKVGKLMPWLPSIDFSGGARRARRGALKPFRSANSYRDYTQRSIRCTVRVLCGVRYAIAFLAAAGRPLGISNVLR